MRPDAFDAENPRRRTFLRALGATGAATLLAGCSEASGDEPIGEGGDPSATPMEEPVTQADTGGSFDCTDLTRGSQTFDPDGRKFQVVWDFPESFGDVEREMANTESLAGARLGHLATKETGFWAYIIQLNQTVSTTTNADIVDVYLDQDLYDAVEPIDYEGQSVKRARASMGDSHTWKMVIPADEAGEYYQMTLVLGIHNDEEYTACAETAVSVADDLMRSFRPNPAR